MSEEKRITKPVKIDVYEIHNVELIPEMPSLAKNLYEILNKTSTSRERLLPLSKSDENTDSDFITSFSSSQGFLFGSFARLTAGEESSVPKAVLDKKNNFIERDGFRSNRKFGRLHQCVFILLHTRHVHNGYKWI